MADLSKQHSDQGQPEGGFTDRELALLEGLNPDDPQQLATVRRTMPSHDSALEEAENAARETPVRRAPARQSAPARKPPIEDDEELEYADDLSASEENDEDNFEEDAELDVPRHGRRRDWIDDDVLEIASGYGLDENSLRQLAGREQFEQLLPVLDQQAAAYFSQAAGQHGQPQYGQPQFGNQPVQQQPFNAFGFPQTQQPNQQQSQDPAQQQSAPTPAADKPGYKDGVLDVEFYREQYKQKGFDEDTVEALTGNLQIVRDQQLAMKAFNDQLGGLKENFERQQQYIAQQEQQKQSNDFHDACDALDPKFFGQSVKNGRAVTLGKVESDRRVKVAEIIEGYLIPQLAQQQRAQGLQPQIPSYPALVRRARQIVFGRSDALQKQTARRRPVGGGSGSRSMPTRRSATPNNEPITAQSQVEELLNNPELTEAFRGYGGQ